ncbi:MAG: UDP-N-acetylglucosamine 2-epimerase (non-hydrolyzing), partial [Candidatus Bathyarchaeota archaeon]|nr:UDP-N-acetylglucosamine 2-epimerase (non-hydrolyzing) [Candidatus Bathyarchaeota archaeon]
MTDIIIAMGTRPEIIKMAPIIRELMQRDRTFKIAYTGQHYDYNLSLQFIEELNLPKPEYDLKVKEVSPG